MPADETCIKQHSNNQEGHEELQLNHPYRVKSIKVVKEKDVIMALKVKDSYTVNGFKQYVSAAPLIVDYIPMREHVDCKYEWANSRALRDISSNVNPCVLLV